MRIGMLGPIAWRTPPRGYGPWEQVVSNLTEGLVSRGHEVTLFATGDSITTATLEWVAPHGYEEDPAVTPKVYEALHIARAIEGAARFDLIHNHFDFLPLAWSRLIDVPMVTTIHGFSSAAILPAYRAYDGHVTYVSISNADRDPSLTYAGTVYHGIRMADFTFRPDPGQGAVVLGRIHPDKGVHLAIEVARRTGMPLTIAGIIHDRSYFDEKVRPAIDGELIRYVGPVGPEQRNALLGQARVLLHLVAFEEPFGLAMIEAMACGVPVIAMRRGAVPEIVVHGETGFIIEGVDDATRAITAVGLIDRSRCRARVEKNFSDQAMVSGYERIYSRVLERHRSPLPTEA